METMEALAEGGRDPWNSSCEQEERLWGRENAFSFEERISVEQGTQGRRDILYRDDSKCKGQREEGQVHWRPVDQRSAHIWDVDMEFKKENGPGS